MIFEWNKLISLSVHKTGIIAYISFRFMNEIEYYSQSRELANHAVGLFSSKLIGYTSDCNKQ